MKYEENKNRLSRRRVGSCNEKAQALKAEILAAAGPCARAKHSRYRFLCECAVDISEAFPARK